ncbi:MAG: hemolysin III family protein [Spartobacteria bacterium]|nr:hemolysin III family protein [Spartobacteria bacterium]
MTDWKYEIPNGVTHGIAALASIAGLVALLLYGSCYGTVWHIVGYSVFGTALIGLFTASTLYHCFPWPRVKRVFHVLDHVFIYILIAGTYTPITLTALRGPWGWSLFGCVWGLAMTGVILKLFFTGRFRVLSTLIYLGMGWMVAIAIKPMMQHLSPAALIWITAGGLAYTAGVVFYACKRIPYHHAIWHLFVVAGATCHYVAMFLLVDAV